MRGMNGIQLAIFTYAWVLLLTVIGRVLKAKTEDGENFLAVAFRLHPVRRCPHFAALYPGNACESMKKEQYNSPDHEEILARKRARYREQATRKKREREWEKLKSTLLPTPFSALFNFTNSPHKE